MNIKKIIRAHDWWGPKLSPIIAVAYATLLINNNKFLDAAPRLILLLGALLLGAVYVSTINDITDIKEDKAAGKINRMSKIPKRVRWFIPALCLAGGILVGCVLLPDYRSVWLYFVPWIIFSMYSIRPIRLKERGVWGVLADASGAHLFPTCFIVSAMSYFNSQSINLPWFIAVAVWAFIWGLRGILWHQFHDRESDLTTGTNTYASKVSPQNFKLPAIVLIAIELAAFATMLFLIKSYFALVFIPLYIAWVFFQFKLFDRRLVIIVPRENGNYQVIMNDYYQLFFPLQLLVIAALKQPFAWIILIIHVLLFSGNFYTGVKEIIHTNLLPRIGKSLKIKLLALFSSID